MISSTPSAAFTHPFQAVTETNILTHSAFSSRILNEPRHDWWAVARKRLDELCALGPGWDGYSAPPISFSNANFALSMLASACPLDAAAPQIVPGANGDLQIEWHTDTGDIELHILAPYDVQGWRLAPSTAEEGEEVHLAADFTIVANWLTELSEASVAARSAAA